MSIKIPETVIFFQQADRSDITFTSQVEASAISESEMADADRHLSKLKTAQEASSFSSLI